MDPKTQILNSYVGPQTSQIPFDDGDDCWYTFPILDEVPPDNYIAEIVFIEKNTNRNNQEEMEICFDIQPCSDIFQNAMAKAKGQEYEMKSPYYIRQRYAKNTDKYRNLVCALKGSCISTNVWDDFIGCRFTATLCYNDSDYGSLRLFREYGEDSVMELVRRYSHE